MKFRFSAIDAGGRVVRGVLRAEDESDARETMIGEELYPKILESVSDDEKATWAPRRRIMERAAGAASSKSGIEDTKPVASVYTTRHLGGAGENGTGGITDSGAFAFVPDNGDALRVERADLEEVRIVGFPSRILRLTLLNGTMHEFAAGFLFASPAARSVARHFRNTPRKDKK